METAPADEQNRHELPSPPAAAANAAPAPALAPAAAPAPPASPDEAEAETPRMTRDSMVTVRLSEPPALTLDTCVGPDGDSSIPEETGPRDSVSRPGDDIVESDADKRDSSASTVSVVAPATARSLQDELADGAEDDSGSSSGDADEVNWEKLERTEDEQTKDEETDNSTTLLLQRLEQENAKLATNPKTVKVHAANDSTASKPRPPSMAQLQQMVNGPPPSSLRYSMLPPPPMTDLEFWAALVKDYQQTAARLPTLLSNKIHKGIPPPLRGVVWQSMSGARDAALEEQYDRLGGESSPYELLIGKDLGRSFPGVDMFRDPEGDGQRMLGRVLKCFSLYDTKIGYCQGLAFLVGPLLMHMPDKQAFCVLVRLMERYDLRACFLPDLSGLHVRIYQFRELLRSNLPALSSHFEELQLDPAYVSQWFLSFFAVTCPLPMLFRIYDVIFAEGASETLMRVALSLMRKNEQRLLACTELEDAMQLLLSRGLWDCYHYDADDFVEDFVSLTGEVSRDNLTQLEQGYRESLVVAANTRTSDITTAATRFLGRIWASSTIAPKPATLSPGASAPPRSISLLRRSTSKQSLASTLNSMEASSASVTSSTSTNASTISRDSQAEEETSTRESTPIGTKSIASIKTVDDRYLHSQIEDLLTALSEMQREHAVLTNQLQREREERREDHKAVQLLLDALKRQATAESTEEGTSAEVDSKGEDADSKDSKDGEPDKSAEEESPDLLDLVNQVQDRFGSDQKHRSSMLQSKAQLREELAQVKDQLANSMSQAQDFNRRVLDLDQEVSSLKDQLRESHAHVRTLHQDKQRLEKQVRGMRTKPAGESAIREQDLDPKNTGNNGGLRELKLSRSKSTPSQAGGFNRRLSSLPVGNRGSAISMSSVGTPTTPTTPTTPSGELTVPPTSEYEAVLVELAQCKTEEAIARQEAEEAKQKLDAFRRAYGVAPGDTPPPAPVGSAAMTAMGGMFGRLTGQSPVTTPDSNSKHPTSTPSGSSTSGGFWGWRR
ncbi:Protein of unknown functionlike protein [Hapsidospora chrysogenum ATCC 11550]|uniref:Rab-GAP TBC domain-containing protein n=1 Tax=Hapsidospora chrysogenum (strain ATCC 11550 / CBS 779.69 / DSM 880 / IAM 14645 / JCM 23072 / IMI 49137) TaxID=857340 RepID=A0A086TEP0_HAPC1|nr:Protein of unknown functionlike protein [Hapsidospora chrysogenum ATCC 11550]